MSNFQRTRSKVWWDDSPPNIGSPIAQASNCKPNNAPEEQDWAPQLPHWIANEIVQPAVNVNNNPEVVSPEEVPVNQWPLRHGSPGSHKSQDSGFSDSDSSPPSSQYYPSPKNEAAKSPSNKSTSSSDSNNNENITVKQVIDFKETPKSVKDIDDIDAASESIKNKNSLGNPNNRTRKNISVKQVIDFNDTPKSAKDVDSIDAASVCSNNNNSLGNPIKRMRSISVIQTPYDLQKYIEVHNDDEHLELLKDSTETVPEKERPKSIIKITITPPENVNNKSKELDKIVQKKTFISTSKDTDTSKGIKIAKVKDLETSKRRSQDSLEYLQVSDNDQIAINNQPRIRSPISAVPYEPAPDYDQDRTERRCPRRPAYTRSNSQQHHKKNEDDLTFQRTRLNKSLNYEGQRLDQQILDIQDGYHSLGYMDEDISHLKEDPPKEQLYLDIPPRGFTTKNLMDSLLLKNNKKSGPKAKQRQASKAKGQTCSFRIFPTKREKQTIAEHQAGGVLQGSRVPFLGLPRYVEHDEWVMVGYPEHERLVQQYNERLIGSSSEVNLNMKIKETQTQISHVGKLTPSHQTQDPNKQVSRSQKSNGDLTHDSKREKLKSSHESFNVQLNGGCTSTPKMLAPHEYMDNTTPQIPPKSTRVRRLNLLENFNETVITEKLNQSAPECYSERSIEKTLLERTCERHPEPVQYWLCDLIGSCENECMTTLQSKALGNEMKAMVSASSATITGNIKKVQTHGQIIVHQYSDVIRQLEAGAPSEEQICLLVANINEFVLAHSITLNIKPPGETPERWDRIKKSLQTYLQKLVDIGDDIRMELNESSSEWAVVRKHLQSLVGIFIETTKAVLVQQLRTLVSIIEEPPSDMILKSTLTSVSHLASSAEPEETSLHQECLGIMKVITELPFVDCAVPRALLTAIIESNKSSVKSLSLRALATVCVSGDAVKQFEEAGGIEILSDILNDRSNPEPQVREAVTVLTQITAPWLRGHYDLRQLHQYLDIIVRNITDIVSRTECCQLLLLCSACVANLVRELELTQQTREPLDEERTESDIIEIVAKYKTVEQLLEAVKKRGPNISVFLQEQTAALINTLSQVTRSIRHLSGVGVVSVALVCFTRVSPADEETQRPGEARAQARLLQHTAEALSRLCLLPDIAHQIVQLEGVPRLTRLVRMQRTRPPDAGADRTLLHCLKTLRSIHKYHPQAFRGRQADVKDMIRPHIMESLMLFSSKKESFV